MKAYLISYDLNSPRSEDAYSDIHDRITTSFEDYWHELESTWIVATNKNAVETLNLLSDLFDANDELLVARLTRDTAWGGFSQEASAWLSEILDSQLM